MKFPKKALSAALPIRPHCSLLGIYSETGFHYGVKRNFVRLWRTPRCRSQVILHFTLYNQLQGGFHVACYFTWTGRKFLSRIDKSCYKFLLIQQNKFYRFNVN
jgi:hypothetical protein